MTTHDGDHRAEEARPGFSIEVGADWVGMESELRVAFGDAKDTLEATAFATCAGDGSSMPTGIVTALTGTAAVQASAGAGADAVADVYATINKVPPRHRGQASWIAAYSTINLTRQFGTAVNHAFLTDLTAGSPPLLLGCPLYEASALDGTINVGADNYMLIAGNFDRYHIIERIRMTVDLVPHLFATGNNRPARPWRRPIRHVERHLMTLATQGTITYVVATATFHGPGDLTVAEGTIKRNDDPIVKAHPNVFRAVEDLAVSL